MLVAGQYFRFWHCTWALDQVGFPAVVGVSILYMHQRGLHTGQSWIDALGWVRIVYIHREVMRIFWYAAIVVAFGTLRCMLNGILEPQLHEGISIAHDLW